MRPLRTLLPGHAADTIGSDSLNPTNPSGVCGGSSTGLPSMGCAGGEVIPAGFEKEARDGIDLNIVHQITEANFQCFGNPDQGVNTHGLLAAFHFSDVDRMEIRFFRQDFLTQPRRLAVMSNRCSDDFTVTVACCHSLLRKQRVAGRDTVHSPLLCS